MVQAGVEQVQPAGKITLADPPLKIDARVRMGNEMRVVRACWAHAWAQESEQVGPCVLVIWFGEVVKDAFSAWLPVGDVQRH